MLLPSVSQWLRAEFEFMISTSIVEASASNLLSSADVLQWRQMCGTRVLIARSSATLRLLKALFVHFTLEYLSALLRHRDSLNFCFKWRNPGRKVNRPMLSAFWHSLFVAERNHERNSTPRMRITEILTRNFVVSPSSAGRMLSEFAGKPERELLVDLSIDGRTMLIHLYNRLGVCSILWLNSFMVRNILEPFWIR